MPSLRVTSSSPGRKYVIRRPVVDPEASPPWEEVCDAGAFYCPARRSEDAGQFRFASPFMQPTEELAAFARWVVHAGAPAARRGDRPDAEDPRRVPVRCRRHDHHDAGFARAGRAPRRLPGFRASADRLPASSAPPARYASGYLLTDPPPGQPAADRRRCVARLAVGVVPAPRLGRSRSDECRPARTPVTSRWRGGGITAMSVRCAASCSAAGITSSTVGVSVVPADEPTPSAPAV